MTGPDAIILKATSGEPEIMYIRSDLCYAELRRVVEGMTCEEAIRLLGTRVAVKQDVYISAGL